MYTAARVCRALYRRCFKCPAYLTRGLNFCYESSIASHIMSSLCPNAIRAALGESESAALKDLRYFTHWLQTWVRFQLDVAAV